MKFVTGLLAVVAFAAFVSCSGDGDAAFCDAARALRTFDKKTADLDDVRGLVTDLVEAAPGEIEDSARSFGESIEATLTGDFGSAADPKTQEAASEVQAYITENCSQD